MSWQPPDRSSSTAVRALRTRPLRRGGVGLRIELGGTAQVCCIHDRVKREVTTERQVAELGLLLPVPIIFDARIHKLHRCSCCENLFFDISDEPRHCHLCQGPFVHQPGGPLPDPGGPVDG